MKAPVLLCLLCLGSWISGQPQGKSMFRFTVPEDVSLKMPFDFSQNLIIIPMRINQSPTLRFVLDSGITNSIITEMTGVDTLQLNSVRMVKVTGLGDGSSAEAYYSTGNRISIDHEDGLGRGLVKDSGEVFILTANHFELSKQLGFQVNGLIGSELFNQFIIQLDPVEKTILFHERRSFNYKHLKRSYSRIPLTIKAGKAYTDVTFVQEDGSELITHLLIDTGASLSFWIATQSDPGIRVPDKTVKAMLGQGLNGDITGVNGRLPQARIGPYSFRNPLVSYPSSAAICQIALGPVRHGIMGNDILRRFTVYMDFPGGAMYLKPNKWFHTAFTYNRSGMEIEKPYPMLPIFTVYSVMEGSAADRAGIKPGDRIENINYIPAYTLTLDDFNHILHGEEGQSITLRITRDEKQIRTKFRLEGKI